MSACLIGAALAFIPPALEARLPRRLVRIGGENVELGTYRDSAFNRTVGGRIATRSEPGGKIRGGFDMPRFGSPAGRLRWCTSTSAVYYLTSSPCVDPGGAPGIGLRKVNHTTLAALPGRGDHAWSEDLSNDSPIRRRFNSRLRDVNWRAEQTLTPEILRTSHIDIACLSDTELYIYVLSGGKLLQYRYSCRPLSGIMKRMAGPVGYDWFVEGCYSDFANLPFSVTQVATDRFVIIDALGTMTECIQRANGSSTQQVCRLSGPITVTHSGHTAVVHSSGLCVKVSQTGVTLSSAGSD
jgi:hypothetical protein